MSQSHEYQDILLDISDGIGTITFNRPKALNSFGGNLIPEAIAALRLLNQHPDTVFTVITGAGRFFSAGADVSGVLDDGADKDGTQPRNDAEKKLKMLARFSYATELLRSMIDHTKVLVLALNGPAVGGGAAWFPGVADIVLASSSAWLQCPFSALGLVPENGSAVSFAQSIGVHRANDFLMFGRKLGAEELERAGLVNYVFDEGEGEVGFQGRVKEFLKGQLQINDGKSMMEMKRLQNAPVRDARMMAVVNAVDALAERFVEGAPTERFRRKREELAEKRRAKAKI